MDIETAADLLPDRRLHALRDPCRKFAAALDFREIGGPDGASAKGLSRHVCCRDSILDGKVDPHTGHGRHRVRGISDAHQAGPIPAAQPIDADCQQLHIVPVASGINLMDRDAQPNQGPV